MTSTRLEKDSLGGIEVPAEACGRAERAGAAELPGLRPGLPAPLPLGARADQARGGGGQRRARAVPRRARGGDRRGGRRGRRAARSTRSSRSTSSRPARAPRPNMNANEVIANRATSAWAARSATRRCTRTTTSTPAQSSNDVIPTAHPRRRRRRRSREDLVPALARLAAALAAKAREFDDVVKIGRTHLMDATPVPLGQEFGGYAQPGARTALDRLRGGAAAPRRAGARRDRRGHRAQRPAGLRATR